MNGRSVLIGAIAAALCASACGSPALKVVTSATTSSYSITGSLALIDFATAESNCFGQGGYSDIGPGTQVTVTDQSGTIVGTGQLGTASVSGAATTCTFPFVASGLPRESFYGVSVSHRGVQNYSFSQLQGDGWQVSLMLGG